MRIPSGWDRAEDMRNRPQEQLVAGSVGVCPTPSRHVLEVCTWSTLRHFDSKLMVMVNNGPLIPWERRLREMEIPEYQEVTSWTRFEI